MQNNPDKQNKREIMVALISVQVKIKKKKRCKGLSVLSKRQWFQPVNNFPEKILFLTFNALNSSCNLCFILLYAIKVYISVIQW